MQKVCVNERWRVMLLILCSSEKGESWVSHCSQAEPREAKEYKNSCTDFLERSCMVI